MQRRAVWLAVLWSAAAALSAWPAVAQTRVAEVVSSPPDLVTTPGVLVRVRGADIHPVGWASNDTLITPFYQNEDGDWFGWIGLMDLLLPAPVQILTVVPDPRNPTAELELRIGVHAPEDPLFAGPRPPAAPCQNEAVGLGKPIDAATCGAKPTVTYIYRSGGAWALFPAIGRPGNIDRTMTSAGKDVPMIARVETGVINRSPYAIALLDDPTMASEPSPGQPWKTTLWNGVLVYGAGDAFGLGVQGETRVGFFDVGKPAAGTRCADALLGAGYALAVGQNTTGPAPYDIVAAETLLRVRERFIKRYALPKATIGIAAGETATALARIAKAYPGLDSVGAGGDAALTAATRGCS